MAATPTDDDRARRRLLCACFAASGTAGLVLEIVWSKYLSLLSGNSIHGVATVVAAFLGGLGLGAWIGGRLAERTKEPLLVYARLEAAVGVFALLSPLAYLGAKPVIAALHGATGGSGAAFLTLRFVLLFVALLPPTVAMGASLPLMTSDFARRGSSFAASVGRLYAWNTAGAVLGVVLAGFALIPLLGLWKTAAIAALLDFAVAFVVIRSPAVRSQAPTHQSPQSGGAPPADRVWKTVDGSQAPYARFAHLVIPLFAVSGFTAILYEVAWTRVLCVPMGGMVYSLSAILAVYLLGLALGAGAASKLRATATHPVALFGVLQVLVAASVVASGHLFGWVPARMAALIVSAGADPLRLVLGELAIVAVVVLPAATLLGALFPTAAAIYQRSRGAAGASVGAIYAANTAGSIAGSVLTGFFLIPWLGSLPVILWAAAVNVAIGLAALALCEWKSRPRLVACALGAAAAIAVATTALPSWPAHRMTIGFARLVRESLHGRDRRDADAIMQAIDDSSLNERIAFFREGRVAAVAVIERGGDTLLVVNGKPDASTGAGTDMVTQVMVGQIPMLVAPRARDVCIVGFGSGVTTNAVLTHPVREVLTLEIEQAVIDAAPWFKGGAGEPLADPRSRLLIEDAGTFLRSTPLDFDVIVSEPSNPWVAGVGDLFTTEFYDAAAARLRPGGIFTQWVQCYEISAATQATILRTLARRFPNGQVFFFRAASDMTIVASPDREVVLGPVALRAAFERPEVKGDMARVGVVSPGDVLLSYVGRLDRLAARAGDGPVNTDDNGWLEHHAPLDVVRGEWRADFGSPDEIAADLAASLGTDRDAAARLLLEGVDRALDLADRESATMLASALDRLGSGEAGAARRRIDRLEPRLAAMKEAAAICRDARQILANAGQSRDPAAAGRAVEMLSHAAQIDPRSSDIARGLGSSLMFAGRPADAVRELRRAVGLIPSTKSYSVRNDLAGAHLLAKDLDACLAEADEIEKLKPGSPDACGWRVRVRQAQGRYEEARAELVRGLARDPENVRLRQLAQEFGYRVE